MSVLSDAVSVIIMYGNSYLSVKLLPLRMMIQRRGAKNRGGRRTQYEVGYLLVLLVWTC